MAVDWYAMWMTVRPVALFLLGMVVYSVFVFKFYRFVAQRDLFHSSQAGAASRNRLVETSVAVLDYIINYLIGLPLLVFFWFLVFTALLVFLGNPADITQSLVTAMALIGAVRVTSYYSESLSQDLAKMFPFALLGVYLLDASQFSFSASWELLKQLPGQWETALYYLGFITILEWILRTFLLFRRSPTEQELIEEG